MYFVYNAALTLAFLLATPYWLFKMLSQGKYRAGLAERLGRVPERVRSVQPGDVCIWIHAVSVGEVLAISQLAKELRSGDRNLRIVISTTTTTGQNLARERFGEENVFYFPLDFGFCIRPYMRALRPKLVVMAETEFWPNFLRKAKRCGARVAVVNARISDRSLPGYRRWKGILSRVLRNVDLFLAQSAEDKRRLVEIGAPEERVQVSGNLKFDVKPPEKLGIVEQLGAAIERSCGGGPVIVAGSTVGWEDKAVLSMFARLLESYPNAVLVLAPRKPERFNEVAELSHAQSLRTWRRSQTDLRLTAVSGGVFLLDSIGELGSLYQLGTCAFVGGSLENTGGHNVLEPAGFGVPVIVGPHTHNFRDIIGLFRRADALIELPPGSPEHSAEALYAAVLSVLQKQTGDKLTHMKEVMRSQLGATGRTAETLCALLGTAQ